MSRPCGESEQSLAAARDQAESANRAKSTFIANMSHELRTPLSAIIGYAEMLTEEIDEGTAPGGLVRDVSKIEGNARHLLGLINDVLDLSKVESGKMEAYLETFDLATMASEVAATVSALMEKKDNRLELQLAPGLGSMHSDVTRIRQVLLNLLSNAAKFTERGTITLSADRRPGTDGADWIRFGRHGFRDRHDGRAVRQAVSAFPTGRRIYHASIRRHRAWAGVDQSIRGASWRRGVGHQRAWPRQHLRGVVAG